MDGPGDDAWGGTDPSSHLIYLNWLLYNKNLSSFKLVKRREANPTCVTCKKAPFNQSGLWSTFKHSGLRMIGKVQNEESRKYRNYVLMEIHFIRLIRNMCFLQNGKPSWKASSQKGLGWEEPQGTHWAGRRGAQLGGALAADCGRKEQTAVSSPVAGSQERTLSRN